MVKITGKTMKVAEMTNEELSELAHECGILVLTKFVFDIKQHKFVFDDYVLDGDLVGLKQFAEMVIRLECEDGV